MFKALWRGAKSRWEVIWNDCWHDATPERGKQGLAQVVAALVGIFLCAAIGRLFFPEPAPTLAPKHIRDAVAVCVLTEDPQACTAKDWWRPTSPGAQ